MSTSYARRLRQNATDAETALWYVLRSSKIKFRRQQPIGRYIVDFVCFSHKLIIECDGGLHAENPADMERDRWLTARGYRILRFWNHEILSNREGVTSLTLTLSHKGRGDYAHLLPLPSWERVGVRGASGR